MNIQKLFAEHAMRELFHKHPVVYVDAGAAGGIFAFARNSSESQDPSLRAVSHALQRICGDHH